MNYESRKPHVKQRKKTAVHSLFAEGGSVDPTSILVFEEADIKSLFVVFE